MYFLLTLPLGGETQRENDLQRQTGKYRPRSEAQNHPRGQGYRSQSEPYGGAFGL